MKTSIFDMNFTLPPLVEMTEVVKDMGSVEMTTPGPDNNC
jgi:sugar phosphate isomerase/epimerase